MTTQTTHSLDEGGDYGTEWQSNPDARPAGDAQVVASVPGVLVQLGMDDQAVTTSADALVGVSAALTAGAVAAIIQSNGGGLLWGPVGYVDATHGMILADGGTVCLALGAGLANVRLYKESGTPVATVLYLA